MNHLVSDSGIRPVESCCDGASVDVTCCCIDKKDVIITTVNCVAEHRCGVSIL